jgi:predicted  nucleic acid-binding Zn ribbon protein
MYVARITFRGKSVMSDRVVYDAVYPVLRRWWESGQINCDRQEVARSGRTAVVMVRVPERSSLSPRRHLPATKACLERLGLTKIAPPRIEIVGRAAQSTPFGSASADERTDTCREPSAYVLYADATREASPVLCADCFRPVPLYRLPPSNAHALPTDEFLGMPVNRQYQDILLWQRDFRRLNSMWFDSGIGERFAHRTLSDPKSRLNVDGLLTRSAIEDATGRRVYYALWQRGIRGDFLPEDRRCPICQGRWRRRARAISPFQFRCDRCRIVSL